MAANHQPDLEQVIRTLKGDFLKWFTDWRDIRRLSLALPLPLQQFILQSCGSFKGKLKLMLDDCGLEDEEDRYYHHDQKLIRTVNRYIDSVPPARELVLALTYPAPRGFQHVIESMDELVAPLDKGGRVHLHFDHYLDKNQYDGIRQLGDRVTHLKINLRCDGRSYQHVSPGDEYYQAPDQNRNRVIETFPIAHLTSLVSFEMDGCPMRADAILSMVKDPKTMKTIRVANQCSNYHGNYAREHLNQKYPWKLSRFTQLTCLNVYVDVGFEKIFQPDAFKRLASIQFGTLTPAQMEVLLAACPALEELKLGSFERDEPFKMSSQVASRLKRLAVSKQLSPSTLYNLLSTFLWLDQFEYTLKVHQQGLVYFMDLADVVNSAANKTGKAGDSSRPLLLRLALDPRVVLVESRKNHNLSYRVNCQAVSALVDFIFQSLPRYRVMLDLTIDHKSYQGYAFLDPLQVGPAADAILNAIVPHADQLCRLEVDKQTYEYLTLGDQTHFNLTLRQQFIDGGLTHIIVDDRSNHRMIKQKL